MRLRILDGQFFGRIADDGKSYMRQDGIDGAQGVLFQCPKCSEGKPPGEPDGVGFAGAHYVEVCFANPINAPVAPASFDKNPRWTMTGSSLDDLTLSPSINLDTHQGREEPHDCKWHGWVTNGEAK